MQHRCQRATCPCGRDCVERRHAAFVPCRPVRSGALPAPRVNEGRTAPSPEARPCDPVATPGLASPPKDSSLGCPTSFAGMLGRGRAGHPHRTRTDPRTATHCEPIVTTPSEQAALDEIFGQADTRRRQAIRALAAESGHVVTRRKDDGVTMWSCVCGAHGARTSGPLASQDALTHLRLAAGLA